MNILFLGYDESQTNLISFLKKEGHEVKHSSQNILGNELQNFDLVISFGYSYIIKNNDIKKLKRPPINLHIALLPYNRGASPNFWSFFDNTPKGVTIHHIDDGIDTGDIIVQKQIDFADTSLTLKDTYNILISEIENLFKLYWPKIRDYHYIPQKQIGKGTFHKQSDLPEFGNNWDQNIKQLIEKLKSKEPKDDYGKYAKIIDKIQQVRAKNNVNWMDILKLAFKHSPQKAKIVFGNINDKDDEISALMKELLKS